MVVIGMVARYLAPAGDRVDPDVPVLSAVAEIDSKTVECANIAPALPFDGIRAVERRKARIELSFFDCPSQI